MPSEQALQGLYDLLQRGNAGVQDFGPSGCSTRGRRSLLGGRNQRAVLALLLLRANEAVSTERLIDQLWGEHPPRTAKTSLQNTIAQLRKLLGPGLLLTRPSGYVLQLDADQLDLTRFERLVHEARSAEAAQRAEPYGKRLRLRRGSPLADLSVGDVRAAGDPAAGRPSARRARGADRGRSRSRGDAELVAEIETLVRACRCASACAPA